MEFSRNFLYHDDDDDDDNDDEGTCWVLPPFQPFSNYSDSWWCPRVLDGWLVVAGESVVVKHYIASYDPRKHDAPLIFLEFQTLFRGIGMDILIW